MLLGVSECYIRRQKCNKRRVKWNLDVSGCFPRLLRVTIQNVGTDVGRTCTVGNHQGGYHAQTSAREFRHCDGARAVPAGQGRPSSPTRPDNPTSPAAISPIRVGRLPSSPIRSRSSLIGGPQFVTIASATNTFASPGDFITELHAAICSAGQIGAVNGGDDIPMLFRLGNPLPDIAVPNCQRCGGSGTASIPGNYYPSSPAPAAGPRLWRQICDLRRTRPRSAAACLGWCGVRRLVWLAALAALAEVDQQSHGREAAACAGSALPIGGRACGLSHRHASLGRPPAFED